MARPPPYLRRVPLGRLLRPDALALFLLRGHPYRWIPLVLPLLRQRQSSLPGSHPHLALLDRRPLHPSTDDRLPASARGTCRHPSGPHARPSLVLRIAAAVRPLDQLPRLL